MAKSVFQYVTSMFVRWRIFRVYISPIIEWYLPVIAHKPRHALARNNILESFQHQMLALVTGASTKVSTLGLEQVCEEPPIAFKLKRLCSRLRQYVGRNEHELRTDPNSPDTQGDCVLRSGKTLAPSEWPGADRKDFGDNIVMLANEFASDTESRDKYIKKKGRNSESKSDFDVQGVQKWVKFRNSEIQRKIRERTSGY